MPRKWLKRFCAGTSILALRQQYGGPAHYPIIIITAYALSLSLARATRITPRDRYYLPPLRPRPSPDGESFASLAFDPWDESVQVVKEFSDACIWRYLASDFLPSNTLSERCYWFSSLFMSLAIPRNPSRSHPRERGLSISVDPI